MPHENQYLLLYVLDLLSFFSRKSDKNQMTAQSTFTPFSTVSLALSHYDILIDLATIFCPGLMSHPDHELSPTEHQLSQDVLEFLITHYTGKWVATPSMYSKKRLHWVKSLISANDASTSTSVSDEGPDGWRTIPRHPPAAETTKGKQGAKEKGRVAPPHGITRNRTLQRPISDGGSTTVVPPLAPRMPDVQYVCLYLLSQFSHSA